MLKLVPTRNQDASQPATCLPLPILTSSRLLVTSSLPVTSRGISSWEKPVFAGSWLPGESWRSSLEYCRSRQRPLGPDRRMGHRPVLGLFSRSLIFVFVVIVDYGLIWLNFCIWFQSELEFMVIFVRLDLRLTMRSTNHLEWWGCWTPPLFPGRNPPNRPDQTDKGVSG